MYRAYALVAAAFFSLSMHFMRKLALLLSVLLIAAAATYLLPLNNGIKIFQSVPVHQSIAYRCFTQPYLLNQWLPKNNAAGVVRQIAPRMFYEALAVLQQQADTLNSMVQFLGVANDSTVVQWQVQPKTSRTPWGRVQQYLHQQKLKTNLEGVLKGFAQFLQQPENVYGISITKGTVADTFLLATKAVFPSFPAPAQYYTLIQQLKTHAAASGAQEVNYPMLNIYRFSDSLYEVTVGLPINKMVGDKGPVQFKRMVPGNILIADVAGGAQKVQQAMAQMEQYVADHRLKPPAIPYQSLITDRLAEPDTSKWKTRIYFPIY